MLAAECKGIDITNSQVCVPFGEYGQGNIVRCGGYDYVL